MVCAHLPITEETYSLTCSTLSEALRPNSDFVPNFYPAGGQRERLATSNSCLFASWSFCFSLLFSVSSSATRCSIAANFSFFFCLHFLEASVFLSLFACWLGVRTSVGATFGSRGSSGPGSQASRSSCKHSHINPLKPTVAIWVQL